MADSVHSTAPSLEVAAAPLSIDESMTLLATVGTREQRLWALLALRKAAEREIDALKAATGE